MTVNTHNRLFKRRQAMKGKGLAAVIIIIAVMAFIGTAAAQGPEMMTYSGIIPQGVNEGDGYYEITFSIYDTQAGGEALWSEEQSVYVYRGTFAVYLGAVQRLDLAFDAPYWVGVKAGGKEEIWPLMAGGYPMPANNTGPTAGTGPQLVLADEVLSANIREADNTSGQGTNTGSGIKTGHIANGAVTTAKLRNGAVTSAKIASGAVTDGKITGPISSAKIQQGTSTVDAVITALTNQVAALTSEVNALKTKLVNVTTSPDGHDIFITGANLHVRSGSGATDGLINGLGNIIIGYNELRLPSAVNDRTGSHNLIVGKRHNFSSFGGMVVGFFNTISGQYASVSGGASNTASGTNSSVSGGTANTANGDGSSVSGGSTNTASGFASSVSGGSSNVANGTASSVSGGSLRSVTGINDWAAGALFEDF